MLLHRQEVVDREEVGQMAEVEPMQAPGQVRDWALVDALPQLQV